MKIALIGIGGYGQAYLNFFRNELGPELALSAAVEPYPEHSSGTSWLLSQNIPVYPDIEELYRHMRPDLTIIASPIPFHKPQAIYAMEHGSHVLCEKPLTPLHEDALLLKETAERTGRLLGVGFQWSFSDTMLSLKKDLLDGVLGRPLSFKTHISWRRSADYYTSSTWKGRLATASGERINDSIVTNATAHYLHNIFFINGDRIDTAARPVRLSGCLGRTYPIETFDTCFLKGELANGCSFLFAATHSGEINSEPRLLYRFEKAVVYYDLNLSPDLYAVFPDGTKKVYGQPLSERESSQKVSRMVEAIRNRTAPCCGVDTILPHLDVCQALFEQLPFTEYPASLRVRDGGFLYTRGLYEETLNCYQNESMPKESRAVLLS